MRTSHSGLSEPELARHSPERIRRLITAERPGFYAIQPTKAELARELGPSRSAAAFAELAGYELGDIRTLRVASLKDFARSHALSYDELSPSREFELLPPPEFGASARPSVLTRTRTLFACVLADAIVSSKSNLILTGDRALLDHQHDELATWPLNLDVDPIVLAPRDGVVTAIVERRAIDGEPLEEAFSLVGLHSFNFGHWMIEFLPRLWAMIGRPGFDSVPILIDEQMVPQHREALELFVGDRHPIVVLEPRRAVHVKKLWTCSMLLYMPVGPKPRESESDVPTPIDGDAFNRLRRKVASTLAAVPSSGPARAYLSRKDTQHRGLVNRLEVEEWFARHGFEIFDPGELSFREQLQRARAADLIVGPDGSGMWNTFLAPRGTGIGYLNNPFLEEHWWIASLARSLGHRLSILCGPVVKRRSDYRKFSDYRIDVATLPAFLDGLAARC